MHEPRGANEFPHGEAERERKEDGMRMKLSPAGLRDLAAFFASPEDVRGTLIPAESKVTWLVWVQVDGDESPRAFHESFWEPIQ